MNGIGFLPPDLCFLPGLLAFFVYLTVVLFPPFHSWLLFFLNKIVRFEYQVCNNYLFCRLFIHFSYYDPLIWDKLILKVDAAISTYRHVCFLSYFLSFKHHVECVYIVYWVDVQTGYVWAGVPLCLFFWH